MGGANKDDLRVGFDSRLKLKFCGSKVTSDAGLLAYRELDEALGLTEIGADLLADSRLGTNKQHLLIPLLRQSIYSEGCYLLRTNVSDWPAEDLWQAYIQLTEAEAAFRIHKSDLRVRPVWHQKEDRVLAHILVCFLAYVLWKTLQQMAQAAGLGDEPRRIFEELGKISLVDVVLPTRSGPEIRRRCVRRPTDH